MSVKIPVIKGTIPADQQREFIEMQKYQTGEVNKEAALVPGSSDEPWLNVVEVFEPGSLVAIDYIINNATLQTKLKGRVLDLGAGTCWVTAKLSKLSSIEEVVALDLSENFLCDVGTRIIEKLAGEIDKIKFAISTFNELPFSENYFDVVFLVACLHHSLSPIKTLMEAKRVLKPNGVLIIVETPTATIKIEKGRKAGLEMSRTSGATEICYTRRELEYLIRQAGFDQIDFIPLDNLTKNPIKLMLRRMLRSFSIEDLCLDSLYVITINKSASCW